MEAMTREPLPGKLPEWPQTEDYTMSDYQKAVSAYWESRARLAVEALHGLMAEVEQAIAQGSVPVSWTEWAPPDKALVNARDALKAICPLPEEDRT